MDSAPPVPHRRLCLALWLVFSGIFLASLPGRLSHLDDAWLGEQAYWLARDGVVRSELFRGFLGYEERLFVFHKLFIPQGALAIEAFGFSRPVLKAVSLPWFLLTLVLLVRAGRRDRNLRASVAPWIGLAFVAHPLVVDYAFTFRPEICLASLGLATYLALRRYVDGGPGWSLILAALLAGTGVLVHLNGVVFLGAGMLVLLADRRPRAALAFLTLGAAVAALYVVDVWLAGGWRVLHDQFSNDPALEGRDFQVLGMLAKLAEEPARWYRHGEDLATTLLVLVHLFLAGASLRREHRHLALYTLGAWIALGLTAQSKTAKYALPLLPLLLLLVSAGLGRWRASARPVQRMAIGAWVLFLALCAGRSWHYFAGDRDEAARHADLLAGIEPGSEVLADLTFVFEEIERYRLRGLWAYRVAAEARGEELDLAGLVHAARADGIRHVVLDLRRSLPERLARDWPRLERELPARARRFEEGRVLVLELDGAGEVAR